jgi:hypothetical protein
VRKVVHRKVGVDGALIWENGGSRGALADATMLFSVGTLDLHRVNRAVIRNARLVFENLMAWSLLVTGRPRLTIECARSVLGEACTNPCLVGFHAPGATSRIAVTQAFRNLNLQRRLDKA